MGGEVGRAGRRRLGEAVFTYWDFSILLSLCNLLPCFLTNFADSVLLVGFPPQSFLKNTPVCFNFLNQNKSDPMPLTRWTDEKSNLIHYQCSLSPPTADLTLVQTFGSPHDHCVMLLPKPTYCPRGRWFGCPVTPGSRGSYGFLHR